MPPKPPSAPPAGLPPALLLLGPTASGKTALVLELAQRLPLEVISVDSAQVFRDMDIGSAKPNAAERARCPHHLIDILSPEESYSAARFRADARALMAQITARGRLPVLAGGTMLYFKALRDGLSRLPAADPELRARFDAEARQAGWPALHARLARLDPEAAARLEPNDAQRIQRALEVVHLTGRPLAESLAMKEDAPLPCRLVGIALMPSDRSLLHRRIEQRFDAMLAAGLVDEVQALRAKYRLRPDLPAMRAVGYRQVWEFLEGRFGFDTLRHRGIVATRQLAKRQMTWIRAMGDVEVLDCLAPDLDRLILQAMGRR
jgi:tRNA dimethylallyltransferase